MVAFHGERLATLHPSGAGEDSGRGGAFELG